MKRLCGLVIAVVVALSACGGDDDDSGSESDNPVVGESPTTTMVP